MVTAIDALTKMAHVKYVVAHVGLLLSLKIDNFNSMDAEDAMMYQTAIVERGTNRFSKMLPIEKLVVVGNALTVHKEPPCLRIQTFHEAASVNRS